jgi:hypothetical protein
MDTTEETLDLQGVATLFKAEPETIAQYARSGELPGTKMGKSWVFLREDALAFLRRRIVKETKERQQRRSDNTVGSPPDAVLLNRRGRTRRTVVPVLPAPSNA